MISVATAFHVMYVAGQKNEAFGMVMLYHTDIDQDWEAGTTTYFFEDGSSLTFSGSQLIGA